MIKFSVLASGSKGNVTFVQAGETRLLLDCGISGRQIERRMLSLGVDPGLLTAILVTHEHSDHISGLAAVCKKHQLPVFANAGTTKGSTFLKNYPNLVNFETGVNFEIGQLQIETLPVRHDANEPVCVRVSAGGKRFSVVTDLGELCESAREFSLGSDALLIESNYDPMMLEDGPYPPWLKRRIAGPLGHLSNEHAAELLSELSVLGASPEVVIAGHLSENTNCPQKVLESMHRSWKAEPRPRFLAASAKEPTEMFSLGEMEDEIQVL